jgi:hypothetical protein
MAEAEADLALIRERQAQYVLEVDVPLQQIKEERRLLARAQYCFNRYCTPATLKGCPRWLRKR